MSPSGPRSAQYKQAFPLDFFSQFGYPLSADRDHSNRQRSEQRKLDQGIPERSAWLVSYLTDDMTKDDHSCDGIEERILEWMVLNAHVTFRASIASSIDCWASIDHRILHPSNQLDENFQEHRDLLESFLGTLIEKLRHFDKAKAELAMALVSRSSDENGMTDDSGSMRQYDNNWRALRFSLESLHAIVERRLQRSMYSIQLMMTDTQIKESRTAIQQAGSVKRLTVLAFIFIPISTVSSAFGMNVQQLTDNPPSIWISFAMMTTVTLVAIVFSSEITHDLLLGLEKGSAPFNPPPRRSL